MVHATREVADRRFAGPHMHLHPGLAALIHPRSPRELLASSAADAPFVVHGLGETIAELTALPFLASLEALLSSWPNPVQVHLPDLADEASAIDVAPADARKLFANGMGLLFNEVHTISPVLEQWLAQVRADLGLSALTQGRCLVYATREGRGTAPHFDQNVNFVLQLHGTKKWWLAANEHVSRPLTRHTMGQAPDPELQTYAREPLPQRMPADAQLIVLQPGSLLFVPRGTWHCTEATCDAMALNFTYTAPTWIDLLQAALRARLALSSEWRASADPASPQAFAALLRALAQEAPHWDAAEILAATEGDPDEAFA